MKYSRRQFISLSGSSLVLGLLPSASALAAEAVAAAVGQAALAQPFLRIDDDNQVTVIAKHLDMGQGIWTGLASIVAEELGASWQQIRVEGAPADKPVYKNLIFGFQTTGGSTSIANSWNQLRTAGATARAMLVQAASEAWQVPVDAVTVNAGMLTHADGRSATFGDMARRAAALPVPTKVTFCDAKSYRFLGKAFARLDLKDKSDGKAQFGIDLQVPGMQIAMVARSPRFGGRLVSFDAKAALLSLGVKEVVQIPSGVAVIADTTWNAKQARALLKTVWDDSGAEHRSSDAIKAQFKELADGSATDRIRCLTRGAPAEVFATAKRQLTADFELPYLAHSAMEPIAALATLKNSRCELIGGFQNQTGDQAAVAKILDLPLENVELKTIYAGGSFGRRATFTSDWVSELAEIVKATSGRYPVKVVWTREDVIRCGYYRPMSFHRLRAALDAQGAIVAIEQVVVAQSFLFGPPKPGTPGKVDPTAVGGHFAERYDVANASVDWINPPAQIPVQMFRALSFNHTSFTKEVFMDELARLAGRDPIEFRLAHLASKPRQMAVLKLAADKANWSSERAKGTALGVAVQESQSTFVAQIAQVRIVDQKIHIDRVVCAIDCGFALNPDNVVTQVEGGIGFGLSVALREGISLKDGLVEQSNFSDYQVLRSPEHPDQVDVFILDSGNAPTGVGEPGSVLIAAAVANALAELTGRPVRSLPLS